jgi:hypothetical protein
VNIGGWRILFAKTQIGQCNRLAIIPHRQRTKRVISFIGGGPGPIDHFALIVDQPRQLDADNPAAIRFAFLADLALTSPFSTRMDQFDAIVSTTVKNDGWANNSTVSEA